MQDQIELRSKSGSRTGHREWRGYLERRGTGPAPFGMRLCRARLVYLRRRELVANWLALAVLLGCWHLETAADRDVPAAEGAIEASYAAR